MNNYIQHHGILGQRWGKKNGPPYPLGASDHSASEKKAGWRKSLSKSEVDKTDNKRYNKDDVEKKKFSLTDKQKKAITIGAAAVASGLIIYGAYKTGALDKLANVGRKSYSNISESIKNTSVAGIINKSESNNSFVTKTVNENTHDLIHGFKRLSQPEKVSDAIKKSNPTDSGNNCYNVVVATIGRICGIDMTAKGDTRNGKGASFETICKLFNKNPDDIPYGDALNIMPPNNTSKVTKNILKKFKEGDTGVIALTWGSKYLETFYAHSKDIHNPGHVLNWIIENGTVVFFDGQARIEGLRLTNFIDDFIDSGKECSIIQVANTNNGFPFETVNLDMLREFVN